MMKFQNAIWVVNPVKRRVSFLTPHTRFVRFAIYGSTRRNGHTRLLL
jgi:hypothetical protein